MNQKKIKIETGFSFLDQKWGGVYPGGNYFIFGSKKTGKTILSLNVIENFVSNNLKVLLITSERKKNLEIQSNSIDFGINEYVLNGLLNIHYLTENYNSFDLVKNVISDYNPRILIIDEIIDENISGIDKAYIEFLKYTEDNEITSFILSSVPHNDIAKKFIKKIAFNSTGIIQLQKGVHNKNYSGTVTLKPNVGHFEGEFDTSYKIEPMKGFITLSDNESNILKMFSQNQKIMDNPLLKQNFDYSNIYNIDEFKFLVESKIALGEQSKSKNYILTYELLNNSINTVELCNEFKKSLSNGDKISYTESTIYILPLKNDSESIKKITEDLDNEIPKLLNHPSDISTTINKSQQVLNSNFKFSNSI